MAGEMQGIRGLFGSLFVRIILVRRLCSAGCPRPCWTPTTSLMRPFSMNATRSATGDTASTRCITRPLPSALPIRVRRSRPGLNLIQPDFQVGDDVVYVFKAGGDAHQIFADAGAGAFFGADSGVGGGGGMGDGGFGVAEVGGD